MSNHRIIWIGDQTPQTTHEFNITLESLGNILNTLHPSCFGYVVIHQSSPELERFYGLEITPIKDEARFFHLRDIFTNIFGPNNNISIFPANLQPTH